MRSVDAVRSRAERATTPTSARTAGVSRGHPAVSTDDGGSSVAGIVGRASSSAAGNGFAGANRVGSRRLYEYCGRVST